MPISFSRYIDITSGVGAGTVVPQRNFIGRLFTDNNLLPPQSFIQFNTAAEVGSYFGTSSAEYARAEFYFSFVSKSINSPSLISFARWVDTAVAPMIFGNVQTQALATYTSITSGSFGLTIAGTSNTFSSLNFSSATSLANVASIIQTAINAETGTMWTGATVSYDATRGCFDFVGGVTGAATISVQAGAGGTDITPLIGWLPEATMSNGVYVPGAIVAPGSAIETITQTLTNSAAASNNFGSFLFMPTLTLTEVQQAATWNQNQNVEYIFTVAVITANVSTWSAGLAGIGGVALTLSNFGQFPEQAPMMILAATDYEAPNSVQNYMFQLFPTLVPEVTSDTQANTYDALNINYVGQTQTAGQLISFYQRGVLFGGATSPTDMNTYANEMWLKDAAGAAIMTLLLSILKVSASIQGQAQILATLQSVITLAVDNGTISVGKTLTSTQILYINQVTNDPNAWYQVQNIGYWVNCVIQSSGNPLVYTAVYTLVYSKDDDIRMVDGTHVLI